MCVFYLSYYCTQNCLCHISLLALLLVSAVQVGDLQYASPATVSRCGMVFVDSRNLGYMPYVNTWLASRYATIPRHHSNSVFFWGGGELFITDTCTCNARNHKRQTEGHPQPKLQVDPHYLGRGRHKSLQRGNISGKTSSLQGSCSPATQ